MDANPEKTDYLHNHSTPGFLYFYSRSFAPIRGWFVF
ncbi:hypothetical protein OPIT5_11985 [Opitutaceae bacterium TAV5]|nr:hypothetical protein OPIT5_11985 [Opitutaceae bacterium TAV5]